MTTAHKVRTYKNGCPSNNYCNLTAAINAQPALYTVTGGGDLRGSPSGIAVGLNGSQTGVTYQLKRDGNNSGSPVSGTGSAISFGLQSVTGAYTITATLTSTGCVVTMTGSAIIGMDYYSLYKYSPLNYVHVMSPRDAMDDVPVSGVRNNPKIVEAITYYDGMGRPMQQVAVHASPTGSDIVQAYSYDEYGRSPKQYLPYTIKSESEYPIYQGSYRTQAIQDLGGAGASCELEEFYNPSDPTPNVAATNYPYAESVFDNSPLNMVKEQGSPGDNWQLYTDKTKKQSIVPYTGTITVWEAVGSTIKMQGEIYGDSPGTKLMLVTREDEDGRVVKQYINGSGQTVLKEAVNGTETLKTWYIYDAMNRLRYIITPMASDSIVENLTPSSGVIRRYCYYYEYDARGRVIVKQNPGADAVHIVYDSRNRIAMVQDGNQRAKTTKEWTFVKYDTYDRPVIKGIYTSNSDRATLQAVFDGNTFPLFETRGSTLEGYTNTTYPTTNITCLEVNYYDDYTAVSADYNYSTSGISGFSHAFTGFEPANNTKVRGMPTFSKTKVLNPLTGMNVWLCSAVYYDIKGRTIQVVGDNHEGGKERLSYKYNFAGDVLAEVLEHTVAANSNLHFTAGTIKLGQWYVYDHVGRALQVYHQVAGKDSILVNQVAYNELGQVIENNYHKAGTYGFIQSVDYTYNIRGWLKKINNINLSDGEGDLFGMELNYEEETIDTKNTEYLEQYCGNISAQTWKYQGDTYYKVYSYTYDNYNQLLKGDYTESSTTANMPTHDVTGYGTNNSVQYDKNGNLLSLIRYGAHDFKYRYDGNRLMELGTSGSLNNSVDYSYDNNGNMKTCIWPVSATVGYNLLNLPETVTSASGSDNIYYSAGGAKLCIKTTPGATETHYLANFVYSGTSSGDKTLDHIVTSFGRLVPATGGNYQYEYYIGDHQGNVRARFRSNGSGQAVSLEKTNYCPFGYTNSRTVTEGTNQYLYNGKEQHGLQGLNWYSFGARYYDPVLGRWHSQDPMSQYASPYNAMGNNPVNLIDRWGMCAGSPENGGGGGGYSGMPSWCDGYGGSYGSSWVNDWSSYDPASNTFGNYTSLAQKMDYAVMNHGASFSNSRAIPNSGFYSLSRTKGKIKITVTKGLYSTRFPDDAIDPVPMIVRDGLEYYLEGTFDVEEEIDITESTSIEFNVIIPGHNTERIDNFYEDGHFYGNYSDGSRMYYRPNGRRQSYLTKEGHLIKFNRSGNIKSVYPNSSVGYGWYNDVNHVYKDDFNYTGDSVPFYPFNQAIKDWISLIYDYLPDMIGEECEKRP